MGGLILIFMRPILYIFSKFMGYVVIYYVCVYTINNKKNKMMSPGFDEKAAPALSPTVLELEWFTSKHCMYVFLSVILCPYLSVCVLFCL